jgi:hypothetical protein
MPSKYSAFGSLAQCAGGAKWSFGRQSERASVGDVAAVGTSLVKSCIRSTI